MAGADDAGRRLCRLLPAAILDGVVPAGGQLHEAHIAAGFEISRSPLREALTRLTRLEEEELIVKIPFREAFVVDMSARTSPKSPRSACFVEPYVAELSAEALRGPEWPGADGSH